MKYGESTFDIVYLLFAVIIGIRILRKRRDAVAGSWAARCWFWAAGTCDCIIKKGRRLRSSGSYGC